MWQIAWGARTFQSPDHTQNYGICHDVFNDGCVVEEDEHLHNAAQPVEVGQTFEVFCHVHQRYQLRYVVLGEDELGQSFSAAWGRVCGAHVILDLVEIAEVGGGEEYRADVVDVV